MDFRNTSKALFSRSNYFSCQVHHLVTEGCFTCQLEQPKHTQTNDVTLFFDKGQSSIVVDKINFKTTFLGRMLQFTNEIHLRFVNERMANCMLKNRRVPVPVELRSRFNQLFDILQIESFDEGSDMDTLKPLTSNLDTLPPEILLKIMSFVPTKDLLTSVTRVSKKFYFLVQEPCVHVSVVLHNNVDIRSAVEFLKNCKQMRKLKLVKSKQTSRHNSITFCTRVVLQTVIQSCPNITELEMPSSINSWIMNEECFKMFTNSDILLKLTHLKLSTLDVKSPMISTLSRATNLKELNLNGCSKYIQNEDIAAILHGCSKLERFKVNNQKFDITGLATLISLRKDTLKSLELCLMSNSNQVLSNLIQCQKLEHLSITRGALRYIGFQHLSQIKSLKSLRIEAVYTMPSNFARFFTKQNFGALEFLSLSFHAMTEHCLYTIANACPNLKHFVMKEICCYSVATNNGVQTVIQACSKLESLTISGSRFLTDECFENISTLLPHLRDITIQGCANISSEFMEKLVKESDKSLKVYKDQVLMTKFEQNLPIEDIFHHKPITNIWFC